MTNEAFIRKLNIEARQYNNEKILRRLGGQGWRDVNYWQEMKIMRLEAENDDLRARVKDLETRMENLENDK